MRVLVTGATGFLGRHVVEQLARRHEVFALCRGAPPSAPPGVSWLQHDLADGTNDDLLPLECDAVVHLAQADSYQHGLASMRDLVRVNADATARLLDHARRSGVAKFVFTSTGSVYGDEPGPHHESRPPRPKGAYATSKATAEAYCRCFQDELDVTVLRPYFIYGPHQKDRFVPNLFKRIAERTPVNAGSDGGPWFNPIYVEDAARIVTAAVEKSNLPVCNVAGTETRSIADLAKIIGDQVGVSPPIVYGPDPGARITGDTKRMEENFGTPGIGLHQGIARVAASLPKDHHGI